MCAGSNPAGGTQHEVPKDPVTSGNAEAGVFAFVQAYAARSGRMSGSVDGDLGGFSQVSPQNDVAPDPEQVWATAQGGTDSPSRR
ncbi:hypothetical protein Shyhy01_47050 [Streptomyces hygroscopicus subsp. hygroscopicus]|nr:hypothetical protein Shyhy01_47050 [Streptomyces hygroscopicus subsp. hygroscopicus]